MRRSKLQARADHRLQATPHTLLAPIPPYFVNGHISVPTLYRRGEGTLEK